MSYTRVGTLIVATIYLQLIQNRYRFRSFTVLHCSHQHRVQPVTNFHREKMLDMVHYKRFPFTELQGKLPCSEKPSRNSSHQSNTFYPNLPNHFNNMDFYNILKSACSSIVSTVTRFRILAAAKDLSFFQSIQTSSSTHPASNSMTTRALSLAVNWPGQTV